MITALVHRVLDDRTGLRSSWDGQVPRLVVGVGVLRACRDWALDLKLDTPVTPVACAPTQNAQDYALSALQSFRRIIYP